MKKNNYFIRKLGVTVLIGAMGLSLLTGCRNSHKGGSSGMTAGAAYDNMMVSQSYSDAGDYWYEPMEPMDNDEAYFVDAEAAGGMGSNGGYNTAAPDSDMGSITTQSRKLIRTVTMELETEEFDVLIVEIDKQVAGLGGYIEDAYTYNGSAFSNPSHGKNNKYANMVIRIPDSKLEAFVNGVSGISNVISKNTRSEDVTLQYVDTESKKKMYLAEEESLLALLEKAESVEDITYLTQRLTEVRYSIERMESTLRTYDNLVDYATVNLDIREVEVLTPTEVKKPKTPGERIADGFVTNIKNIGRSFQNAGINFLISLPYLILVLVIIGLIILAIRVIIAIIKKAVKKKKAKKLSKAPEAEVTAKEEVTEADKKEDAVKDVEKEEKKEVKKN